MTVLKKGFIITTTLFFSLFIPAIIYAQSNSFEGTWQMQYLPDGNSSPINIELQISAPENNILYPAHLTLQCDGFKALYELLLVKKTIRELAISKNKYALYEKPFSIGNTTILLNGIFDNSRGAKGVATLTLTRMQPKLPGFCSIDTMHLNKVNKLLALRIKDFLKDGEIILKKINGLPQNDDSSETILSAHFSKAYFGLQDTIHLQNRDAVLNLNGNKKNSSDNDMVSVSLNGQMVADGIELDKKTHSEDIYLNSGLNLVALFADNYGNGLPNKGKATIISANKNISLDFNNKADSAAGFIVARLYYNVDKEKLKTFENYIPPAGEEKPLQKNEKLLSSFIASSQQLTFGLWDDALEDGDSVSISINGKWLVQGFRVKIKPQFITVTLKPGPNTIRFIADNLGSIPPNTSVLEITDGNKRKSFTIETTPGENNFINILYDVKNE